MHQERDRRAEGRVFARGVSNPSCTWPVGGRCGSTEHADTTTGEMRRFDFPGIGLDGPKLGHVLPRRGVVGELARNASRPHAPLPSCVRRGNVPRPLQEQEEGRPVSCSLTRVIDEPASLRPKPSHNGPTSYALPPNSLSDPNCVSSPRLTRFQCRSRTCTTWGPAARASGTRRGRRR